MNESCSHCVVKPFEQFFEAACLTSLRTWSWPWGFWAHLWILDGFWFETIKVRRTPQVHVSGLGWPWGGNVFLHVMITQGAPSWHVDVARVLIQWFWWHMTRYDGTAHSIEVALIFTEIVLLLFSNIWEVGIWKIQEVGELKLSQVSTQSTSNGAL